MKPITVMLACIVFAGASVAFVNAARAAEPVTERVQINTRSQTQDGARQRLRLHQDDAKNATPGSKAGKGEMRRERARKGDCDKQERRARRREHRGEQQQGAKKQCKGSC